ncbi:MAG: hypothetical protein H6877_10275 [Rhodobiaceae bacterium]|nr:hypothetical protein [Rhodobiaceae bacterium]
MVQPRRRVAPRPVVGLCRIEPQAGENGFDVSATNGLEKGFLGIPLANAVWVDRPELVEAGGGRARACALFLRYDSI